MQIIKLMSKLKWNDKKKKEGMFPKAPEMNGRLITSTKNECVEASLKMQSESQHVDIMGMDYFVHVRVDEKKKQKA